MLDRQLLIFAATRRRNREERKKLNRINNENTSGQFFTTFSGSTFLQIPTRTLLDMDSSVLKEEFDLKENFAVMGLANFAGYSQNETTTIMGVSNAELPDRATTITDKTDTDPRKNFKKVYEVMAKEDEGDSHDECKETQPPRRPIVNNYQARASNQMKSLRLDSGSFGNLLPEFIADTLTQKLLQTRGVIRRFLKVLLRDHDWIRIFTYKSRPGLFDL